MKATRNQLPKIDAQRLERADKVLNRWLCIWERRTLGNDDAPLILTEFKAALRPQQK